MKTWTHCQDSNTCTHAQAAFTATKVQGTSFMQMPDDYTEVHTIHNTHTQVYCVLCIDSVETRPNIQATDAN